MALIVARDRPPRINASTLNRAACRVSLVRYPPYRLPGGNSIFTPTRVLYPYHGFSPDPLTSHPFVYR